MSSVRPAIAASPAGRRAPGGLRCAAGAARACRLAWPRGARGPELAAAGQALGALSASRSAPRAAGPRSPLASAPGSGDSSKCAIPASRLWRPPVWRRPATRSQLMSDPRPMSSPSPSRIRSSDPSSSSTASSDGTILPSMTPHAPSGASGAARPASIGGSPPPGPHERSFPELRGGGGGRGSWSADEEDWVWDYAGRLCDDEKLESDGPTGPRGEKRKRNNNKHNT